MSKKIDYTFKIDGFFNSVNYYRSELPLDVNNMPLPMQTGISSPFTDTTAEAGKTYYVRFGSIRNDVEKLSEEIVILTSDPDPHLANVELLVFADSDTYPSYALVDSSLKAHTFVSNTSVDSQKVSLVAGGVTLPKFDKGSIRGNSQHSRTQISPLGTGDYTLEFWIKGTLSSGFLRIDPTATGTGQAGFNSLYFETSGQRLGIAASIGSGGVYLVEPTASSEISVSDWRHVCYMRKNGFHYLFVGGVPIGSTAIYGSSNFNSTFFKISGNQNLYLNSIRVTIGVGRYQIAGFTPPDSKFPNV